MACNVVNQFVLEIFCDFIIDTYSISDIVEKN